jgi:hypothetical protein
MAKTTKELHEELRNKFLAELIIHYEGNEEEVLRVKSNEIAIPCVDSEGNEEFVTITVKVPTGSRDDGEPYDGYGMAEQYATKVANDLAKAEKAKADKEKKIAKDKAAREAKARAKAEHEAKKNEGA